MTPVANPSLEWLRLAPALAPVVGLLLVLLVDALWPKQRGLHVAIGAFSLAAGASAAVPGEPAKRPYQIAMKCLEKGFYVRYGGDTIQLAPPFIFEKSEIDSLINALGESLHEID